MARILITGSTTGIGLETAQTLQGLGHDVVWHARSKERAADLDRDAEVVVGDLASLKQTRELADAAAIDDLPIAADTQVWLATGADEALVTGRYLKRRRVQRPNPAAGDIRYQDGLLHACADLSGVEVPQ